jgi:SpoVK/Ycf46/Vps4 family AAA+-type ATPase
MESKHPTADGKARFDALVGIERHKESLVAALSTMLAPDLLRTWLGKHHKGGLPYIAKMAKSAPLVILSGDVGCGKTALANCVGSPVGQLLDRRVLVLETPSDIRGGGLVGELSLRITEAFEQARRRSAKEPTILIIDESDDVATSRSQTQAHHEDRAGVNVLIKQLDLIAREELAMAVIMITNRESSLDPAVLRRAALILKFDRPGEAARTNLFERMLEGTGATSSEIQRLVKVTSTTVPYTYSDLTDRVGQLALRLSWQSDRSFSADMLDEAITLVAPSPQFIEDKP